MNCSYRPDVKLLTELDAISAAFIDRSRCGIELADICMLIH